MGWLRLGALAAVPVALAGIPTAVVEHGPTLCLYRLLFGWECWGCGMTRALSCAFHGQFARAWDCNHLVVIVGPLLAGIWVRCVIRQWRQLRQRRLPAPATGAAGQ